MCREGAVFLFEIVTDKIGVIRAAKILQADELIAPDEIVQVLHRLP
jgi:hypothetical protein